MNFRDPQAALPWNRWQACRGMGGRLAMESVAGLAWNTHQGFSLTLRQSSASSGAPFISVSFDGFRTSSPLNITHLNAC